MIKTRPVARSSARWFAASFFALSSAWNYLDRFILSAAGPQIQAEFHLNNTQFGWLLSAFGLSYALASPLAGWFLDWLGLESAIVCAVGVWSLGAALCGWSRSLAQLIGARVVLGAGESAGVPAAGKLNGIYLEPKDRAVGAAITQVGLAVGGGGAPLLVGFFTSWRSPFFVSALLGLGWIPLWILVRRTVEPWRAVPPQRTAGGASVLRDSRLLRIAFSNLLWMTGFVLWTNWTTIYLVRTFHITTQRANGFAWFPPVVSTLGAFVGGWLSQRAMKTGKNDIDARRAALLVSAIGCLVIVITPFCDTPLTATLTIAASYFFTLSGTVNIYTIPVDIWGPERAGMAVSALVGSYGLLQLLVSPGIGWLVDRFGFMPVCWLAALPPLAAWWLLRDLNPRNSPA